VSVEGTSWRRLPFTRFRSTLVSRRPSLKGAVKLTGPWLTSSLASFAFLLSCLRFVLASQDLDSLLALLLA